MNGNILIYIHCEENIRCDGKVLLGMYLKVMVSIMEIRLQVKTRDEIFLYPNLPD